MLLSITTTRAPATDLGFLLHKHPDNVRSVSFPFGDAHVFYPVADDERCTASVLLEIDPVRLARGSGKRGDRPGAFTLGSYVNDRPYVASSFMSVVVAKLFGTAMGGRCEPRPELPAEVFPLECELPVVACRGGEAVVRSLFEPLGYEVSAEPVELDPRFPEWGASPYMRVRLTGELLVKDLLSHLYVLLPVLDDDKHYWVGDDEVEKLLRKAESWLGGHPGRELIVQRYLRRRRALTSAALAQLTEEDEPDPDQAERAHDQEEADVEERVSLATQRIGAVVAALRSSGASRVVDLGCGEGRLLRTLIGEPWVTELVGVDASHTALEIAERRLKLDRLPEPQRERVKLLHSGLTYRDRRLAGYDAAVAAEVVEHLDPPRLGAFERSVFEFAAPTTVIVTTPNREYNVCFESLPAGDLRHRDHRFEWTRAEFGEWAGTVAATHGYSVRFLGIGPDDEELGSPTQMAVFQR
jgi:3' terminal RNA ribose 2'-O-methyltransferase Hen1